MSDGKMSEDFTVCVGCGENISPEDLDSDKECPGCKSKRKIEMRC